MDDRNQRNKRWPPSIAVQETASFGSPGPDTKRRRSSAGACDGVARLMRFHAGFVLALVISLLIAPVPSVGNDAHGVTYLMGSSCQHGPATEPNGNFVAFVFCDSALGTNLGIVLSRLTNETDATDSWGVSRRFWQSGPWVTDVTSIAWDPFSHRLYVATAETYGDGGVFALDLVHRKHDRIFSIEELDPQAVRDTATAIQAESHFGSIESLNVEERKITVSIRLAYGDGQSRVVGEKTFDLGSGS